jgi:predicted nucleic acid-binding protein
MNSQVCVDASVALKLVLNESDSDQAQALWSDWLQRAVEVIAPYHLTFETTSVIRNRIYRGDISPEDGESAFEIIHAYNIRFLHPPQLVERAWQFATHFNRPTVYESFYLALSEYAGCELWTADRRLYSVVTHELPWVKWLGDFRSTT